MVVNIANLYGMNIFTASGRLVGKVQEVIVDLEKGEIIRVALEPLSSISSKEQARHILKEKSILYKYIKSVGDVIIVDDNYKE